MKNDNNIFSKFSELLYLLTIVCLSNHNLMAGSTSDYEQPGLKEALEKAPFLKVEELGEPARGVNVWERWFVPNKDGKSWDVLQIYFKEYYGPTWLYAIDLGDGTVNKQRLPDDFQFYLSGRTLGFDGNYYIAIPYRRTWNMHLFVYDPDFNSIEDHGEIVKGLGGEVRPLALGPDGRIYGTGTRGSQLGLYIYDPKIKKVVKDFGPIGPKHPNGAWSRYSIAVDETHVYVVSGMVPAWYLIAVNIETGEQQILMETPTERVMDIIEQFPSGIARVPQQDGSFKEYWLYRGEAILRTNDTPPWKQMASPWSKAVPRPEVYFGQIDPDENGVATLWYRIKGDSSLDKEQQTRPEMRGWRSIKLTGVETYPHRINPISILPDGRIYGTGDDYTGTFIFDPRTDKTIYCGPRVGLSPYTTIVYGGKLYMSGYPGGALFVYDPSKPWTLGKGGPPWEPPPPDSSPASNPRRLGEFRQSRVGLMHSSALGADGRVYFGGFGLRSYTGGGIGWYDPATGKIEGFWRPLSGYRVFHLVAVDNGKYIVISTAIASDELNNHRWTEEAKLFVYDVFKQQIVRDFVPIPKSKTTGMIIENGKGQILGLTSSPEKPDSTSVLYTLDINSGKILNMKSIPSRVSIDSAWPHWIDPGYEHNDLVRGPDGYVWTYLRDVLIRINPENLQVSVIGKINPPGYLTFVGDDLYFSGSEKLRRIKKITSAVKN